MEFDEMSNQAIEAALESKSLLNISALNDPFAEGAPYYSTNSSAPYEVKYSAYGLGSYLVLQSIRFQPFVIPLDFLFSYGCQPVDKTKMTSRAKIIN